MTRTEFSTKTKLAAWERSKGHCELCGMSLRNKPVEYDHTLQAYYGGDNSLDNCKVLCRPCHRHKTTLDNSTAMPKSRRLIRKGAGIRGRKLKGRPMPGTKASGIRKKLNGDIERR